VFLMSLAALWFGCSNSAREIVGEWAVYHRERMVNLKIPSYVGAKFALLGGLCFVQCAILLAIVYFGAGLRGPLVTMFLMILLTSLVGLAIGLTISALARTSEVAIALLPLILLPMVILAGVLQPLHKMNGTIAALAQAMPSRWAFEGLLVLEAEKRPAWTPPAHLPIAQPVAGQPVTTPPRAAATPKVESEKEPKAQDMAENFFPAESDRMGVISAAVILVATLLLLATAIHAILLSRDVH
jgi:ABC transport system ATP-binding/permease protein